MMSSLKLTTNTPLGKEELKKLNIIIQSLLDNNESFEFRVPVDWKGMGLTDYTLIVKNPMDLGSVRKKLLNSKYQNVEEVLDDIQLIWDNCKLYNQAGSWIHNIADKLDKTCKKMIKNYLPNIQLPLPGKTTMGGTRPEGSRPEEPLDEPVETDEVTYQEKLRFSQRIKNLSQEDLGRVVDMIRNLCPDAFRELEKDRAQIIVDNLDNDSFQRVNEKIDEIADMQGGDRLAKKVKI